MKKTSSAKPDANVIDGNNGSPDHDNSSLDIDADSSITDKDMER